MSSIAVNTITDASGGNSVSINSYTPTASNMAGRNRIINGDMRIDQRNAGASVTATSSSYTLDRWQAILTQASKYSVQQNSGSVTPPDGFTNYLGVTSLSAYSVLSGDFFLIQQWIEGFNTTDLNWGTANAKTVTLSFWVRSSLTGTFGGSITNSAQNRSYPFTYAISSANTWEQKFITIAGDTTGTWLVTNGRGMGVWFGLGVGSTSSGTADSWAGTAYYSATGATSVVGTSGATFYITGVQLEEGSVATPFEHRQYGQELALCQRYFVSFGSAATDSGSPVYSGYWISTSTVQATVATPVTMRSSPSVSFVDPTTQMSLYRPGTSQAGVGSTASAGESGPAGFLINSGTASGLSTTGYGSHWRCYGTGKILASAEL